MLTCALQGWRKARKLQFYFRDILSWISIDSDAVTVPLCLGGDFSGDEKMPEIGSKPCSSYTPRSARVIPVFLCASDMCAVFEAIVLSTFPARQHYRTDFRDFRAFFAAPCFRNTMCGRVTRAITD